MQETAAAASWQVREGVAFLAGRLDAAGAAALWPVLRLPPPPAAGAALQVDASGVTYCDGAGLALLLQLQRLAAAAGCGLRITGLAEGAARLLAPFDPAGYAEVGEPPPRPVKLPAQVGEAAHAIGRDLVALLAYVGELTAMLARALRNPRRIRWRDVTLVAETAGTDALPIVLLVGFLLGLILAFQAAIPMRMFGADLFVASLVGISIVRELGPLMTAIVLTGRSGSAFAAEIGTMTVNEEVDALATMGLEPVWFLAVPRVLAGTVVTPLLTIFANLAGLAGGLVVMLVLGFPFVTYVNQIKEFVGWGDLAGGLAKAVAFGFLVSAIGCLRGLQTGRGPSAVGAATTRAVVSGIVLITVADGLFAVLFHCLGW
ncbi:MAG: ABC transporter permease [Lentisphaeria bacterium]|jgi:phospholipid/cholesterol/gamma-HCH transport system permease protein